jgi:hypothetical protein
MKLHNLFTKKREGLVHAIEASQYRDDNVTLPNFEGMYTIKNTNLDTGDDLFYFRPEVNMLKGYIDAPNAKTLNLLDGKPKLVISMVNSFYHSVLDSMSELLCALEKYPKNNVVVDVSEIWFSLHGDDAIWDIFNTLVESLRENGTEVNLVRLKEYDVIYMDNFRIVDFLYESGRKSDLVYSFFKKKVTNPEVKPHRSVFVSRALTEDRDDVDAQGLSYLNDRRIDDHVALEKYFASLGYDIIHAEKFPSFQEQLDYFYSVKTIVGITGSGLTNAAFMQPGGVMVEIVTPLIVPIPFPGQLKDITDPFYVQEIHNFYKNLAYYQNHTFMGIENPTRSFEEFTKIVNETPGLKRFLDRNE